MTMTKMKTTCKKCNGTSFYRDQDNDLKCLTCGQLQRETSPEIGSEVERRKREADYWSLSAQQRADKRYRESELYKQTRRKHQKKYRESEKGKEAKKRHVEKTQILERLLKRLQDMGWIE